MLSEVDWIHLDQGRSVAVYSVIKNVIISQLNGRPLITFPAA